MTGPPDIAYRLYALILRAYPADYQETFGDEMRGTFLDGADEARSQGTLGSFLLRELHDTPKVLAAAYWNGWKRKVRSGIQVLQEAASASDLPPAPPDGRDSWIQVAFECSPFIIAGLLLVMATYLPVQEAAQGWQRNAEHLGRIIVPFSLPLLLLGLARGLPRWTYPCGGLLLGYYAFISNQAAPGLFLLIMLFFASLLAIAAILTDPQPALLPILFRRIGQSLSTDWTRLSFAVYGAMPLLLIMAFDDSHQNNRTPLLALSALGMIVGALMYCRSRTKAVQMLALFAGMTLCMGCAWLDQILFAHSTGGWTIVSTRADAGDLWLLSLWVQWIVLLLAPGILPGRTAGRQPRDPMGLDP